MDYKEFVHWKWMYEQRPFGEVALDARLADMLIFYSNSHSKESTPLRYFVSDDKAKSRDEVGEFGDGESLGLGIEALRNALEKI